MFIRRALLGCAIAFSFSAFAAESPYLTHKQLDIIPFMPAPVANGSADDRAQQILVLAAQKAATPERIALANSDAEETVYAMFSTVLGANFKPANLPLFTAMFARMGDTEDAVVDPVKAFFGRTRPFLNNPDIKPLVKPSKTGSYPSGHTSRSTMMAIVLSSMLPEQRAAIFARANDYAESRVIGGMHYPNDLDAGRRAGSAMAATLLASPTFNTDFDAAKVELRKTLGLQ
jgi:acid phosphatase (class A)